MPESRSGQDIQAIVRWLPCWQQLFDLGTQRAIPGKQVGSLHSIQMHPVVEPDPCPLCKRPNYHPSDHHLVPKSRGGKETETTCCDCHQAIHAHFTNKELERTYNTVEALMDHEAFRKTVAFISKQDPTRRVKTKRPKDKRQRGRSG